MSTKATPGGAPERKAKAQQRFKALLAQIPPKRAGAIKDKLAEMPVSCRCGHLSATLGRSGAKRAIKAFCLECMGWHQGEVTRCNAYSCPLWEYRP